MSKLEKGGYQEVNPTVRRAELFIAHSQAKGSRRFLLGVRIKAKDLIDRVEPILEIKDQIEYLGLVAAACIIVLSSVNKNDDTHRLNKP